MQLLNALALSGLVAMAVPIYVHLRKRRQTREVTWAAMEFLTQSLTLRRKGLTLENLLVLFCRCLLVALFALAMSRPLVSDWLDLRWYLTLILLIGGLLTLCLAMVSARKSARVLSGILATLLMMATGLLVRYGQPWLSEESESCDLAIVLDTSATMRINREDQTNWQRAVDEAKSLIRRLNGKSTASIVLAGPTTQIVEGSPFRNLNRASQSLDQLKPSDGGGTVLDAIQTARTLLDEGVHPSKRLVVLSDTQLNAWQVAKGEPDLSQTFSRPPIFKTDTASESIKSSDASRNQVRIFGQLAEIPAEFDNLAITNMRILTPLPSVHRAMSLEVDVVNSGTMTIQNRTVQLTVDGQSVASQTIPQLEPSARTSVRFVQTIPNPGSHGIRASIPHADLMESDNRCEIVTTVVDQVRVLLVDGNRDSDLTSHSSLFANLALDPQGSRKQLATNDSDSASDEVAPDASDIQQLFAVQSCSLTDLDKQLQKNDFEIFQIVMLCDVPQLSDWQAEQLANYVEQGGCLWAILDKQSNPAFYNAWKCKADGSPLMPGNLLADRREHEANDHADSVPSYVDLQSIKQAEVKLLVERGEHDLSHLGVKAFRELKSHNSATVSMQLTHGAPLMLEHRVGRGQVLLQAISLSRNDSNLISLASFPVLMHLWAEQLASKDLWQANFSPTNNLVFELPKLAKDRQAFQLTTPDGQQRRVNLSAEVTRCLAQAGRAAEPGIYQLRSEDPANVLLPIAVTRAASESDLQIATSEKLKAIGKELGIEWIASTNDLTLSGQEESERRELWKWTLYAVLCFLAIEPLVIRWVHGRRTVVASEASTGVRAFL